MLAIMAGIDLIDTGQFSTYLFMYALPQVIRMLVYELTHGNDRTRVTDPPWSFRGTQRPMPCKRVKKFIKPNVSKVCGKSNNHKNWMWTYLFPIGMATFWVGCCIEMVLRCLGHLLGRPPPHFTALLGQDNKPEDSCIHFDTDSYPIGVDNHALRCMANTPHLFENLVVAPQGQHVSGIAAGIEIRGVGTYIIRLQDNQGKIHEIKIPNSLYIPKLRQCLLSPQHWAQEAKTMGNKGKTWMENYWDKCVLRWGGGKFYETIPHDAKTNTPVFHSAPASAAYRAFVTTFEACDAPFFSCEHVLQFPGGLREHADPAEFITEENIHLQNYPDTAKVREDDETIKTSNLTHSPSLTDSIEPSEHATRRGALTFDPSPPATADKDTPIAAANNQAELMR
jgi:hypothetical protein